jgi:anti-sigma regulatory factor (Ser/Thr protein kinase)
MEWSQTYPGLASMVPAIRAFVRAMLINCPRLDDAELITSELATNSLRHTPSSDGGDLTVTVTTEPGFARIAVTDQGEGGWKRPISVSGEGEENGRGLWIVDFLADKVGHEIAEDGQTMWAELNWQLPPETRS